MDKRCFSATSVKYIKIKFTINNLHVSETSSYSRHLYFCYYFFVSVPVRHLCWARIVYITPLSAIPARRNLHQKTNISYSSRYFDADFERGVTAVRSRLRVAEFFPRAPTTPSANTTVCPDWNLFTRRFCHTNSQQWSYLHHPYFTYPLNNTCSFFKPDLLMSWAIVCSVRD